MLKNLALQINTAEKLHMSLYKIKHMLYSRAMRVLEEVNTHPSIARMLWLLSCKGRWQIPASCTVSPKYVQRTWKASSSYMISHAQVKPSMINEQKICSFSMTVWTSGFKALRFLPLCQIHKIAPIKQCRCKKPNSTIPGKKKYTDLVEVVKPESQVLDNYCCILTKE